MTVQFKKFYTGFSTRDYSKFGKGFTIHNLDCVTNDLLNEIFTTRGERLYMPDFGTRIPLLVFEPNDIYTQDVVREDLTTVFEGDPRVKVESLVILPDYDKYALIAIATLTYIEFNVTQDLRIEIKSR